VSKGSIVQTIREKEMDRRDFLKYVGIILLGVIGLRGLISLLSNSNDNPINKLSNNSEKGHGFGSGRYGA